MLFCSAHAWEVVPKATREVSCSMANVGISRYNFPKDTLEMDK